MAFFSDIRVNVDAGAEGLIVEAPKWGVHSYVAEAAVRAGFLAAFGTDRLTTRNQILPLPALPAADVDAISLAIASAVAPQNLTGVGAGALSGVVGIGRIYPAQSVTVNFAAIGGADWDTAFGYLPVDIFGEDAAGRPIHEVVIRNNAGAVAVQVATVQAFSRIREVDVGASNGAGGTATIGTDPTHHELSVYDYPGIVAYDVAREGNTLATTFAANETCAAIREGYVWATPTAAAVLPYQPVHVRTTAGGGVLRGALYGPQPLPAGGNFAPLLGAQWVTPAGAGGLALIRIGR